MSDSIFLATSKLIAATHPHLLPPTMYAHQEWCTLLPMGGYSRTGPTVLSEDTQKARKPHRHLQFVYRKPGYLTNSQSQGQHFVSKSHCDRLFRHTGTTPDRAKHQGTELCVFSTVMTYKLGATFMSSLSCQAVKEDRAT